MTGQVVHVPGRSDRIACLEVLCFEKLLLVGAADRVVVMTRTKPPWMETVWPAARLIRQLDPDANVEELLSLRVDAAFRTLAYPAQGKIDKLAALGIPVLVSQAAGPSAPKTVEEFLETRKRMVRLFAAVVGGPSKARAEAWCAYHDEKAAMVRARLAGVPPAGRPRAYYLRGPAANHTQGVSSATYCWTRFVQPGSSGQAWTSKI